jgi:hypothetical protein
VLEFTGLDEVRRERLVRPHAAEQLLSCWAEDDARMAEEAKVLEETGEERARCMNENSHWCTHIVANKFYESEQKEHIGSIISS